MHGINYSILVVESVPASLSGHVVVCGELLGVGWFATIVAQRMQQGLVIVTNELDQAIQSFQSAVYCSELTNAGLQPVSALRLRV